LYRSQGISCIATLKLSSALLLIFAVIACVGGYFAMHVTWSSTFAVGGSFSTESSHVSYAFSKTGSAYFFLLSSSCSALWSSHLLHVSIPANLAISYHLRNASSSFAPGWESSYSHLTTPYNLGILLSSHSFNFSLHLLISILFFLLCMMCD
jgi:hypothetical protein